MFGSSRQHLYDLYFYRNKIDMSSFFRGESSKFSAYFLARLIGVRRRCKKKKTIYCAKQNFVFRKSLLLRRTNHRVFYWNIVRDFRLTTRVFTRTLFFCRKPYTIRFGQCVRLDNTNESYTYSFDSLCTLSTGLRFAFVKS